MTLNKNVLPHKKNQEVKLVFENIKSDRGTEFRIYTDGSLEFRGSTSTSGLYITVDVMKWVELPQKKTDSKEKVLASFQWENKIGEIVRIEDLESEIYHSGYYTYIRPVAEGLGKIVRKGMRRSILMRCEIAGKAQGKEQLKFTKLFRNASQIRNSTQIKNIEDLTIITAGGRINAGFKILKDDGEQIYIAFNGIMDSFGHTNLSRELNNLFENWLEKEELFLCSLNNNEAIIVPSKVAHRKIVKNIIKAINYPSYSEDKRQFVSGILTHPNLKLKPKTWDDFEITEQLRDSGITIEGLITDQNHMTKHTDQTKAKEIEDLVQDVFSKERTLILPEVRIFANEQNKTSYNSNTKCMDLIIIKPKESELILIEIKTSPKHSQQTKQGIAELKNLQRKLGESVIPIMFINYDIKNGGGKAIVTEKFGTANNIILIGSNEMDKIKQDKNVLLDRIEQYKQGILSPNRDISSYELISKQETSKDNELLFSKLSLLESKLSLDVLIHGTITSNTNGAEFEKETQKELEKEGYQVIPNVSLSRNGIMFEVDLLVIKGNEITFVSCKDRSDYKIRDKLTQNIKLDANVLEHRMNIFNPDNGLLFVKTLEKHIDKMKEKFENMETNELRIIIK